MAGTVTCYGYICPICDLEGSLNRGYVYLPCGMCWHCSLKDEAYYLGYAFCELYITTWFDKKKEITCPTCKSAILKKDKHF
jgi:hypothetical protein